MEVHVWLCGVSVELHPELSSSLLSTVPVPEAGGTDDILDLLRLRARIREELVRGRELMVRLTNDFERVEADIQRLTGTARKSAIGHEPPQKAGEFTLLVFEALEQARRPLNAKEIARKILTDEGQDADDKDMRARMVRRVNVCLWTQTQKGRLRQSQPKTSPIKWELADPREGDAEEAAVPWHSQP